jgi:LysR family transcriptional regulator, hypochlorite-specific transcription factor HypT
MPVCSACHARKAPTMNLSWLDDFLVLAENGNFSRAAAERNMTQPAFSRRIRALEEWVGVTLIDRGTHPATLTEAGEWFRSIAQELRARVARIPDDARAVADAGSATLRFAATHALSFTFLPAWLRSLETRVAVGPIQVVSDVMQHCETLMLQGRAQFLLSHAHRQVPGRLDLPSYRYVEVGTDRLLPVSAPDRQGRARHPLRTRGKARVPMLAYSTESGIGRMVRALRGAALEQARVEPVFTAHLATVLRTMALDSRGVAWLPATLVDDDLKAGRLVTAGPAHWNVDVEIRLTRSAAAIPPVAEAFWQALGGAGSPRA